MIATLVDWRLDQLFPGGGTTLNGHLIKEAIGMEKLEAKNNDNPAIAAFIIAVITIFLPLQGGEVWLAIWDNILGTLGAVGGIFSLLAYRLSGVSEPGSFHYVPLYAFASFDSADLEIISRKGLIGEAPLRLSDYWHSAQNHILDYEKEIRYITWSSVFIWLLLIALAFLSFFLAKKRTQLEMPARATILTIWIPIVLVPFLCEVTVLVFKTINTVATFVIAGIFSLIIFVIAWDNTVPPNTGT